MSNQKNKAVIKNSDLPLIPEKLYFTIGEVGTLCNLRPHVLRYWEQEFALLSPSKRRGNRRYYQRKDVLLIREIKALLYEQGYTIEGARLQLSGEATRSDDKPLKNKSIVENTVSKLEAVLEDLT
jgi:DNA-binding transcriptional MerR regulator